MKFEQKEISANEHATIYRYSIVPYPSKLDEATEMMKKAISIYRDKGVAHNIYVEEGNPFDVLIVEYAK